MVYPLSSIVCISMGSAVCGYTFENFGVTRAQRRAPPRRGTLLLSPVCAVVPPLGDARRPRRGEHHAASLRRVAGAYVFMSSGLTETLLSVTETGTSKVSVVCLVSVKQSTPNYYKPTPSNRRGWVYLYGRGWACSNWGPPLFIFTVYPSRISRRTLGYAIPFTVVPPPFLPERSVGV